MAITKKQLRDDLILRFTQGRPTADFEIPNPQIDHWLEEARDLFVSDFLSKTMQSDSFAVDPVYIHHVASLAITSLIADINTPTNPPVLTIPPKNDRGVLRVRMKLTADGSYRRVSKIDMYNLENIELMEFSAPTYTNPAFYRIGDNIYIVGPTSAEGAANTLEIDYVPAMLGANISATADFSLSAAHVGQVVAIAEEIGRRELGLIIVDQVNDGSQTTVKQ